MPEKVLAVIGALSLAALWAAMGETLGLLLMWEITSRIDAFLCRLWRRKAVPELVGALAIMAAAVATMALGPFLFLVPLARQRTRELVCYYAQRWA